jgi:hypothetical protein
MLSLCKRCQTPGDGNACRLAGFQVWQRGRTHGLALYTADPQAQFQSSARAAPASTTQRPFLWADAHPDRQPRALMRDMVVSTVQFPEYMHGAMIDGT